MVGGSDAFHHLLKVAVLGVKGDHVKLGFEVESAVPVHRLEDWERIVSKGESLLHATVPPTVQTD